MWPNGFKLYDLVNRKISVEDLVLKAKDPDPDGILLIHEELRFLEPSMQVIKAYLDAVPERITMTNQDGSLPIHICAQNLNNLEILQYLLEKYPESIKIKNKFGFLPIA